MKEFLSKLPYSEHGIKGQLYFLFLIIIKISLVIAFIEAIYKQNWMAGFMAVLAFTLSYIPDFFKKSYHIKLPLFFEFFIVVFVYAAIFLGEVQHYYAIYWWWDLMLHGFTSIAFGIAGFILLYLLVQSKKLDARPGLIVLFAFCFAVAIGAVWEIFEFGMDQFFGFNMQKSGLLDTMTDLIIDSTGALIASISGYIYLKGKEKFLLARFIKWFKDANPQLFIEK